MVLQAKLERRQRCQSGKSGTANEESRSGVDNVTTGHPQNIPPPSEPVLPAGNKVLSPKAAGGPTASQMARQPVHLAGETVPHHNDIHVQSPPRFTEDKSEARHGTAGQKCEFKMCKSCDIILSEV